MKRAILIAAVLASGCGGVEEPPPNHGGPVADAPNATLPPDHLEVLGQAASGTDVLLAVAQEHCDRPIVGRLAFVPERLHPDHRGYCRWACRDCPMDAWVEIVPGAVDLFPAWMTFTAHELGHWCLRTPNEEPVLFWADRVNREAEHRASLGN